MFIFHFLTRLHTPSLCAHNTEGFYFKPPVTKRCMTGCTPLTPSSLELSGKNQTTEDILLKTRLYLYLMFYLLSTTQVKAVKKTSRTDEDVKHRQKVSGERS